MIVLGVADGEVGYSGHILAVILAWWGLCYAFSFLNDAQVKSYLWSVFSAFEYSYIYIATLPHQSFPFLKVTERDRFDPSYSWQLPVERDPKIGRELGIWYRGLAKVVFYSFCSFVSIYS